jgi:hypothetical protein
MANKTARIVWAVLARGEAWRPAVARYQSLLATRLASNCKNANRDDDLNAAASAWDTSCCCRSLELHGLIGILPADVIRAGRHTVPHQQAGQMTAPCQV